MEKIRIQKIMSDSGVCSRRKAEEYISEGRVKVNGRPCKLGDKAFAGKDIITLDGEKIYVAKKRQLYYIRSSYFMPGSFLFHRRIRTCKI